MLVKRICLPTHYPTRSSSLQVRLHDGSERRGRLDAGLLQIIEDVHGPKCGACGPPASKSPLGSEGGANNADENGDLLIEPKQASSLNFSLSTKDNDEENEF